MESEREWFATRKVARIPDQFDIGDIRLRNAEFHDLQRVQKSFHAIYYVAENKLPIRLHFSVRVDDFGIQTYLLDARMWHQH